MGGSPSPPTLRTAPTPLPSTGTRVRPGAHALRSPKSAKHAHTRSIGASSSSLTVTVPIADLPPARARPAGDDDDSSGRRPIQLPGSRQSAAADQVRSGRDAIDVLARDRALVLDQAVVGQEARVVRLARLGAEREGSDHAEGDRLVAAEVVRADLVVRP